MTLVFVHVPKTAGTTLQSIISRLYKPHEILAEYPTESLSRLEQRFKAFSTEQQVAIKVILGHFPYGSCNWSENRPTYVTVLREPIDRLISHYHFVKRAPDHYLHQAVNVQDMSLEEYVASGISLEMDNGQTRMICGPAAMKIPFGQCTADMLAEAKYNLRNKITVVGLTEDFDRTVILMGHIFGWNWPFYIARNRTRNRPQRTEIAPETIRIMEKQNRFDIALYNYARELFDARVRAEGPSFEREVLRFKQANVTIGKLYCHLHEAPNSAFRWMKRFVSIYTYLSI